MLYIRGQPSAISPLFFDNLHFEDFDGPKSSFGEHKSVNHESRLTLLSKCSKWRLSKNRGLVADGWANAIFLNHFWFDNQKSKDVDVGFSIHPSRLKRSIKPTFMRFSFPNISFLGIDCSFLRASCHIRQRRVSATFFARLNACNTAW